MNEFLRKSEETKKFFMKHMPYAPEIAIILGSGLNAIGEEVADKIVIPYKDIPNLKDTKVETHSGNMMLGEFSGKKVVFFKGRIHFYEGHDHLDIAFFPVVVSLTGAEILIVTNLVGGIRGDLELGDLVVITDHYNLSGYNPLISLGKAKGRPLFVDMYDAYSSRLRVILKESSQQSGIRLREGKLAFLSGPNFETQMELEYLQNLGADVVGWSMVPEVLVARSLGMEVVGISCVSDISDPECFRPVDSADIFNQGIKRASSLKKLLDVFLSLIPDE
tara:strand:+ start:815 stop:1645 length:831 start_codon:yes stop_codon:yes gene_type:complete